MKQLQKEYINYNERDSPISTYKITLDKLTYH